MKKTLLFAMILGGISLASCTKKCDMRGDEPLSPDPRSGIAPGGCFPNPGNCEDVVCTAMFAQVTLRVNAGGNPVNLDSFVVTDMAGTPLPPVNGMPVYGYISNGDGEYTVINDGWVAGHQNTSMQVRVKGFKNNIQVVNEVMTIGADCCHVSKVAGVDTLTVQ